MRITEKIWSRYIDSLRNISDKAAGRVQNIILLNKGPWEAKTAAEKQVMIEAAYAVATGYGEAAATLACEFYDAIVEASGLALPAAEPAATATIEEVAMAINGTAGKAEQVTASAIGRLVKLAGVDTTLKNAIRDKAQFAWVPHGDTCAFCIALASRGWQDAKPEALKGGHASHVHSNCDCTYAVRFSEADSVQGYNPEEYAEQYYGAPGASSAERINTMRREFYADNKRRINAQKRSAYAKRQERNASAAEEEDVS